MARFGRGAWVVLLVLAVFPIAASVLELVRPARSGIPADHEAAFRQLAGVPVRDVQAASPGVLHYVATLEKGYALHELVFGLLFLAIVVFPLRRREPWAWWSCWAVLIADLGYTFTFGRRDSSLLARALVADIALPVALLVLAPSVLSRSNPPTVGSARSA